MLEEPKIIVVGTGAIGSFYGAKLSQAGAHVSTVSRSDYDIVKKRGITIKSILGDFIFKPKEVVHHISEYPHDADYIIVATKVLPDIDIVSLIKDKVTPNSTIVLLQNGIEIENPIVKAFPENEIISGLAFICANRLEYGLIDHIDYGRLVIGRYPSGYSERVKILADLFSQSGITCDISEDVIEARWKKLLWNAPFNPISVLAGGVDTAAMMSSPPTVLLAKKVMEEVALLANKSGHPIPGNAIQKNLDDTAVMKPYKTSMLLDYESKRTMEVESILGNALKIAKRYEVEVPHIESLYGLLSLMNKTL